eukprot:UN20918
MEMYNKSNGSDAFERTKIERKKIYKTIPLDIDILLTHCPPENMLCGTNVGDPLLAEILVNFKNLKYHIFGHDHSGTGIIQKNGVTHINAAQKQVLKDRDCGGLPFVFDYDKKYCYR